MKKALLLVIGSMLFIGMISATQTNLIGELFSGAGCPYCPSAQLGLEQLYDGNPNVIPILWYSGLSPAYQTRAGFYGVSGVPNVKFNGNITVSGGMASGSMYSSYLPKYNEVMQRVSPIELSNGFFQVGDQVVVITNVDIIENLEQTNNKVVTVLTRHANDGYRFLGVQYHDQPFELANAGESGNFIAAFDYNSSWNLDEMKAISFVQAWSGDKIIYQAYSSDFSGELDILSNFSTNVIDGARDLTVNFKDFSISMTEITSWQWDFDGDGEIDSEEQNPTFIYTEPGTYTVSLTVSNGTDEDTKVIEDMITVYDNDNVQGSANGVWSPEYGTYNVVADVVIPSNASLTILPGTQIYFAEGTNFKVLGSLEADGTKENPIVFSSDESWGSITITNNESEVIFNNCLFSNSISTAMKISNSNPTITSCTFQYNTGGAIPGALSIEGMSNVNIAKSFFSNNFADNNAGAVLVNSGVLNMSNTIIANNTGQNAGAIILNNSANATLVNCTIANNEATAPSGTQIMNIGSLINVMNTIFYGSTDLLNLGGFSTVTYSNMANTNGGEGCINQDPLFVNPTENIGNFGETVASDWILQADSPCVDAGNQDTQYNDLEDPASPGNALFPSLGTIRNDMGAYGGQARFDGSVSNDENVIIKPTTASISAYPNPFNPNVNIEFNRSKSSQENIQVDVYNIRGQKINNLYNQISNEKTLKLFWNGVDKNGKAMPSGIYFIKAASETEAITKKVILLK